VVGAQHRRAAIERRKAAAQPGLCGCSEIQFGDHDPIGSDDLFLRNLLAFERANAGHGINGRHHVWTDHDGTIGLTATHTRFAA
jgi:hypothetical protein